MMTKEQRQMVAAHVADTSALTPWGASVRACLADADRFAATDRARRVGEAVIAEFDRCNAEGLRFGGGALYEIVEQALRGEP